MQPVNLLKEFGQALNQEQFETLLENPHIRLQRIISPPAFRSEPFQQPEDEWVLVLQGEGILEIADEQITLGVGDSLLIPAGTPHRVITTSIDPHCIWLAFHLATRVTDPVNA
ncbi:cupin domain-containing protein [Sedimenticola selenatireducens]|jgi:cupin 2 domain-containing protein|uniref:Cupin domain-containing protein n=1 Tax=Sedimenticola selenatireducens TaxID=191960 RepID=A0A557SLR3_9GAMM|nr:cupin domain-containing protein [Sedimenticola selenatireducens]TVO78366.1 cupin domain-containing protein [Sedimenticola selenatireducens]TVT62776.1 MAG: cupin domain-containing protein [Sedimenticola selenatireducens]